MFSAHRRNALLAKSCQELSRNFYKAFCSVSVQSLEAAANRKPEPAVLFYATDYPEAGGAVAKLIATSGFAPVNLGGINQSVRIEAFGDLNEYGKLGRLVTSKEAKALI
jgi:8-hydroxy-5-deazaflavin:NADPH oxidoreductase